MKNLKYIGMFLVCFLVMGLNVWAKDYAKIGDKTYTNIAEAFLSVKTNEEIIILNDIDLTQICNTEHKLYVPFADNVTVNLNGYSIKSHNDSIRYIGNNLTVKNGTFVVNGYGTENEESYALFLGHTTTSSNYTLENITLEGGLHVFNAKNVILKNVKAIGTNFYSVWAEEKSEVIIESGEFTSKKSAIIGLLNDTTSILIKGGTFVANNKKIACKDNICANPDIIGGTFNINPREYVKDGYKEFLLNGNYNVGVAYSVLNHAGENGVLELDKETAVAGETVKMKITPNEGYQISSIKVIDKDNNVITVTNNEFKMPNSDVWVKIDFEIIPIKAEMPEIDLEEEVEEITVGIKDRKETENIILESIETNKEILKKINDTPVKVDVEINNIKEDILNKTIISSITKTAGKAKVATYFDITLAIKNAITSNNITNISELNKEIELTILLPEDIKNIKANTEREYFIIREHNGKVEKLSATLSKDGKYLTFKSKYFSTYALAYEDVEIKSPQTLDTATTYLLIGTSSIIGFIGLSYYIKKKKLFSKKTYN